MLTIRPAIPSDVPQLLGLIRGLADFEHLPMEATEKDLLRDGFGSKPKFRALMGYWQSELAGYAFFFPIYSTFEGRAVMFLEDVFVRDSFRGKGIGKALMARVAAIAKEEDCFGLRWQVLDWNQPAIDLYRKLGGEFLDQWETVSLHGEAFLKLAADAK